MHKKIFYLACLIPFFGYCTQMEVVKNLPKAQAERASEILREQNICNEVVANHFNDSYAVTVSSGNLRVATNVLHDRRFAEPAYYGVYTPAYPNYKPCGDAEQAVFTYGSLLYWMPTSENIDFALLLASPAPNPIGSFSGTDYSPRFTWKPGWRVGGGFHTTGSGWDIDFQWTQFYSTLSRYLSSPNAVVNTWMVTHAFVPNTDAVSTIGSALWKLRLNYFQFVLEKSYYVDRYLSVLPYGGLKNAWVDQQVWLNASQATTSQVPQNLYMKSKFWGIGPTVGINARFSPFNWVGIFADINSAFYSGNMHSNTSYSNYVNAPNVVSQLNERIAYMLPQIGGTIGVDLAARLMEQASLYLSVGYEASYWFDAFSPPSIGTMNNNSSLSVQGFTGSVRLDF